MDWHKIMLKTEKRMIKKISTSFFRLANTVATLVEAEDVQVNTAIQAWFDILTRNILPDLKTLYVKWGRLLRKTMWLQTGNDIIVEQAVKFILNKRNEMLWESKLSITQTTKNKITDIIVSWLNWWKSYTQIWQDIRDQVKEWVFSKARSELIAVREVWQAYEQWRKKTLEDHILKTGDRAEKYWWTVNDDKVTEKCRENQADWRILFNEIFPSGDIVCPRKWNPRCRCTTKYRLI